MTHSLPKQHTDTYAGTASFAGFAAPTSNTTFTPNQFFDVCLRFHSRGVVRLVAYLIRQTLGWCDADGNPLHERVKVSYGELVDKAGISRGQIRGVLDQAIAARFVECVQAGKASTARSKAESAYYQLRWDSRPKYVKDPEHFQGFFESDGNRTDIPNQFFDRVVPTEPLSVTKVVGSIIRFSIGFQAARGRRRQQVALSYRDIERYARICDTHTLSEAIRGAELSHYIFKVQEGFFDRNHGARSRKAIFTLRWADSSPFYSTGSKTPAGGSGDDRFENPSGTGSKTPTENRFENPSGIETKLIKEIGKQQQAEAATQQAEALLRTEGFTEAAARALSSSYPEAQIVQQLAWLAGRAPRQNRLGMLRKAIEENWPAPQKDRHADLLPGYEFAQHFYAGLAGNPGAPVAEPSSRDVELAKQFIDRLITFKPAAIEPSAWARVFAGYVRERKQQRDVPSLVLALRLHGDAWLLHFAREQARRLDQMLERKRAAHRKVHEAAWLRFLADAEESCRRSKPSEYTAFTVARESSRWQVQGGDSERMRLVDFQRHFHLPDFWQWDGEFNEHPLCK